MARLEFIGHDRHITVYSEGDEQVSHIIGHAKHY